MHQKSLTALFCASLCYNYPLLTVIKKRMPFLMQDDFLLGTGLQK